MRNITKFSSLILLFLLSLGVNHSWADEITVYVTGEIFIGTGEDAWDNATSTIKVDVRKGHPECFDCNDFNGLYNQDMTNTGYTYNGYPIYSYTLNQAGAQFRFKHYKSGVFKENYTTDWHSTTNQIYRGYYSDTHHWITYGRDVTFYATPEKMDGSKWKEGTYSLFANFKYGDGDSEWKRQQMTKTAYTYSGDAIYTCTMLLPYNVIKSVQFLYNDGSDHDLYVYTPSPQLTANDVDGKVFRGYINSTHTWAAYGRDVTIYTIPDYLFKDKGTPYDESIHYPAVCIQMGTGSTWNTENLTKTSYMYESYPIYTGTILIDQNKFWEYQIKYFKKSDDTQVDLYQFNKDEPKTEYAPSYIDDKLYHGWNGASHDFFSYRYDVTLDMQGGGEGTASIIAIEGEDMPDATMPSRVGYTFGGYWTGTNGTGTQYYDEDGTSLAAWDSRTITTLYAKWTEIPRTITLQVSPTGAGTISPSGTATAYINTNSANITATPNPGWKFKEWQFEHVEEDYKVWAADTYTSTTNPIQVKAKADATLTAVFEPRFVLVGSAAEDGNPEKGMPGWSVYTAEFTVNSSSPVNLSITRSLEANTKYKFQVHDRVDGNNYGAGTDGQYTLIDGESAKFENKNMDVKFDAIGAGDYIFQITDLDGNNRPTVTVNRPHQVFIGRRRMDIDGNTHDDDYGGTVDLSQQTAPDTWTPISNEAWVPYGVSVKYNAAKETGYALAWFTASDYNTQFSTADYWFHIATTTGSGYAQFSEVATTVTLSNDGKGKVQISETDKTSTTVGVTTTRSLTAVPNDGYKFASWTKVSGEDISISSTSTNPTTLSGLGAGAASGQEVSANFDYRWALKAESDGWGSAEFIIGNISTNASGDVVGYVDISLSANTNYQFTMYDKQESQTYKNGTDKVYYMTNGNSYNWSFATDKTYNCGITTAGAGTYRFTWNVTDKTISVTYPNFVIYRTGDKADDPRKQDSDVEYYAGGTIAAAIEYRMKVHTLDQWYTLCLPFTVSNVKVWDDTDGKYYDIVPYYRTGGKFYTGHYILRSPSPAVGYAIETFETNWQDPDNSSALPAKNVPYIIQWHDDYFEDKYISFFGATGQSIPTSMTEGAAPSDNTLVNVYGNDAMTSGSISGAYMLEPDYGAGGAWLRDEDPEADRLVLPFECYIRATAPITRKYRVIRRGMTIEETATGWQDVLNSNTKAHIVVYTVSGIPVAKYHDCSFHEAAQQLKTIYHEGLFILRADNESVKLMLGGL